MRKCFPFQDDSAQIKQGSHLIRKREREGEDFSAYAVGFGVGSRATCGASLSALHLNRIYNASGRFDHYAFDRFFSFS